MSRRIEWSETKGTPMSQDKRDAWVEDMIRRVKGTKGETIFTYCGDSLVVVLTDKDGDVEVFDALVRRHGVLE